MYLIAQNPFRDEGESLPIHLNLRGWDTSGPNSRWLLTWLWKQTTGDWAVPPSSKSTETSRTNLFNFYIYNCAHSFDLYSDESSHTGAAGKLTNTTLHTETPHPTPFSILRGSTDLNANQFLLWRSILIQRWYLKAICWFVHKCVPMILYLVHIKIFLQIYFSACVFIYRAVLIQSDKKTKKSTLGALLRFHSRPPFYLSPQSRWWPRGWRDPVLCCCKCQP